MNMKTARRLYRAIYIQTDTYRDEDGAVLQIVRSYAASAPGLRAFARELKPVGPRGKLAHIVR